MSKAVASLIAASFLLSAPFTYRAQVNSSLVEKIERAIAAAEPGWQHRTIHREDAVSVETWKLGKRTVKVGIELLQSPKDAYARMKQVAELVQVPGIQKLKGLGDDANIVVNHYAEDHTAIHFRRGSVLVLLDAPSPEEGKRFAHHVANQIIVDSSGKLLLKLF